MIKRPAGTPPCGRVAKRLAAGMICRESRRKLWLKIHLYLGLFVGAVFTINGHIQPTRAQPGTAAVRPTG
ncbi:propeptide PepSY amd peptidase M4 [Methylocaldum marinum]|uniref:Propeptide PepSY amd peptidase M4 n=1 Tax=Methylocaldum marinum TaxID=1432792 RepID=A0A250KSZ4_9GAMM|nr:propeptide PepSY amd peptidase M4 [Methylocaldum marinum]